MGNYDLPCFTNEVCTPTVQRMHEIVGVVTEIGSKVEKFKIDDKVGVGYFVVSCRSCESCVDDLEQYCTKHVRTICSLKSDGTYTNGGYSDHMVSNEHFVFRWPDNLPLASGAPLLCAGITSYSPLKYFGLDKPGKKVGVVGLGGVSHVAVKMVKAFCIETQPARNSDRYLRQGTYQQFPLWFD